MNVCFERVEVTFADGQAPLTVIENPGRFNLLDLQNGVTAALGGADLPVGLIQQIRVIVCEAGNTVTVDGAEQPLTIPSGTQTGIKLTRPGGFEIRDNVTTTVTIDFDAGASVHFAAGNGWMLKPHIVLFNALRLEITSPIAEEFIAAQPFTVTGSFESPDGDPVTSVLINGVAASLTSDGFIASIRASLVAPNFEVVAVGTTASGKEAVVDVWVVVDNVSPQVAITSPTNGALISSSMIVEATASDNVGIAQTELFVDGLAAGVDADAPYSWSLDTSALASGVHTLLVIATDPSGSSTTSEPVTFLRSAIDLARSRVTATPLTLVADGQSATTIRIELNDATGQAIHPAPVDAVTVFVTGASNVISAPVAGTDKGEVLVEVQSTTPGFKHVSVSIGAGGDPVVLLGPMLTFVPAMPKCGNGVRDSEETCDDGNVRDGDGCRRDCRGAVSLGKSHHRRERLPVISGHADGIVSLTCQTCGHIHALNVFRQQSVVDPRVRFAQPAAVLKSVEVEGVVTTITVKLSGSLVPGALYPLVFELDMEPDPGDRYIQDDIHYYRLDADLALEEILWEEYACEQPSVHCGFDPTSGKPYVAISAD